MSSLNLSRPEFKEIYYVTKQNKDILSLIKVLDVNLVGFKFTYKDREYIISGVHKGEATDLCCCILLDCISMRVQLQVCKQHKREYTYFGKNLRKHPVLGRKLTSRRSVIRGRIKLIEPRA